MSGVRLFWVRALKGEGLLDLGERVKGWSMLSTLGDSWQWWHSRDTVAIRSRYSRDTVAIQSRYSRDLRNKAFSHIRKKKDL